MAKIAFVNHKGEKTEVEAKEGSNVMQAAVNKNVVGVIGECGGAMACCTCHVIVDEAWIEKTGTYTDDEAFMLEMIDYDEKSRLSCQIKVTEDLDGLVVNIPENQGL